MRDELVAERCRGYEQRAKLAALEERCKRAEKLLSRVPREVVREIKKRER